MVSAVIGLLGVLVGSFATQALIIGTEGRTRRLDALVAMLAASGRVIGAHERLSELFQAGSAPSLTDDRAARAVIERSEAHAAWRSARARVEVVHAGDPALITLLDAFEAARERATPWVQTYYRLGERCDVRTVAAEQRESWEGMLGARRELIAASRARSVRRPLLGRGRGSGR